MVAFQMSAGLSGSSSSKGRVMLFSPFFLVLVFVRSICQLEASQSCGRCCAQRRYILHNDTFRPLHNAYGLANGTLGTAACAAPVAT